MCSVFSNECAHQCPERFVFRDEPKRYCPNEVVQMTRAQWSHWTSCEVEQRVQTCIFSVPAFDDSIHPFYVQMLPSQAVRLIQDDPFAYRPNCDLESVCWSSIYLSSSAWSDGSFPCWMGMLLDMLKMDSIGDCLEVRAVPNPICFEVWVERGVSQMLHFEDIRSMALPWRIEENRFGLTRHSKVWSRIWSTRQASFIARPISRVEVIPSLADWRMRCCARSATYCPKSCIKCLDRGALTVCA